MYKTDFQPMFIIAVIWGFPDSFIMSPLHPFFAWLLSFTSIITFWIILVRSWLYYYQIRLIEYNNNKEWRMAIDPINEESNWYVKNIGKYGNALYLTKLVIVISIFESFLFTISWYLQRQIPELEMLPLSTSLLVYTIFYGLEGWFLCKIQTKKRHLSVNHVNNMSNDDNNSYANSNFNSNSKKKKKSSNYNGKVIIDDTLGIKAELIAETIMFVGMFTCQALIGIARVLNDAIFWFNTICILFAFSFFHTYFFAIFPALFQKRQSGNWHDVIVCIRCCKNKDKNVNLEQIGSRSNSNTPRIKEMEDERRNKLQMIRWVHIVPIYDGFEALMQHLVSEFSTENLLFIQEVCVTTHASVSAALNS